MQRIESWEDVPLEFSRPSTDSVIVSVALRSCDPFYPVLPSFVGMWMLKDPPEAFTNNLESADNSNSVVSLPMMTF